MKLTVTIPADLEEFFVDAMESGEYENAEQIVTDALYLLAEMVDEADLGEDEPDEGAVEEDLLAQMSAKLDTKG